MILLKQYFQEGKFKVSPSGGDYSRLFVFNGVHDGCAV